jgi:hypothetical protein
VGSDLTSIITQLEQQRDAIDRALAAGRSVDPVAQRLQKGGAGRARMPPYGQAQRLRPRSTFYHPKAAGGLSRPPRGPGPQRERKKRHP